MKRYGGLALFGLAFVLSACGGGGAGTTFTQISGVVTDLNGDVVRSATVWCNGQETTSNSGGVYMISGIGTGERVVHADIWKDGAHFTGHNVVNVFANERSKSVNIAVVNVTQQARMHGSVRDRNGFKLAGARVFAYTNQLSSLVAITNQDGDYTMNEIPAGLDVLVTASGRTFDSDTATISLTSGEDRRVDFMLSNETNPLIPAPTNFSAVAWTTPFELTRSPGGRAPYDAIKKLIDPRYRIGVPGSRTSSLANHVEVDLYWDPVPSQYFDSLLGYGIYRATTSNGQSTAIDFLRDPNALFYSDLENGLRPGHAYYYEITSLNTSYPDTNNSESGFSDRYGVQPLDDMIPLPVTQGPLTFHWQAVSGATGYQVYLFDQMPTIGVTAFWDNSGSPTSSTSLVYTGPSLVSGRRYYYVVLGTANGMDSRTLSVIEDFVAN